MEKDVGIRGGIGRGVCEVDSTRREVRVGRKEDEFDEVTGGGVVEGVREG